MATAKHRPARRAPRIAVVIMAAGKGTRLKSKHPKVLHEVGGKSLLAHVIAAASKVVPAADIFAVIGHEADRVRDAVAHTGINFVVQAEQRGTGHALMVAKDSLMPYDEVIVLSGDAPFIGPLTIQSIREFHDLHRPAMTILTAELHDPSGYGRVVRRNQKSAEVTVIVEEKSATAAQRKLREINAGFYAFDRQLLFAHIDSLRNDNTHREYYLTDMAEVFRNAKKRVMALPVGDPHEILGSNTRAELVDIDRRMRLAKARQLMVDGVTLYYPETSVIDSDVEVNADTIIEPYVQILGKTRIGSDCRIGSYVVIRNSVVGDGVTILPGCVIDDTTVRNNAVIGPYSRLRPGSEIGEGAHVGNFVETKKTRLGKGSKANHLTYLGDTEIGEGVNVGAGTITCNYDGERKHPTVIEDGAFIGSDTTLVAPVKVGRNAYIGAGSCITDDVPPDSLAIGRGRQIVKEGWVKRRRSTRMKSERAVSS